MKEYLLIDMQNMSDIFIYKKDFRDYVIKTFNSLSELENYILENKLCVDKHSFFVSVNRYFSKFGYSVFCVVEDKNTKYLVVKKGIVNKFNHIWFNKWINRLTKTKTLVEVSL